MLEYPHFVAVHLRDDGRIQVERSDGIFFTMTKDDWLKAAIEMGIVQYNNVSVAERRAVQ